MSAKEHDRHTICKVTAYVDDAGRKVEHFEQMFGKNKESFYKGSGVMRIQGVGPQGPTSQEMRFEFAFPEDINLKKAFELFDVEAKKAIDDWQKKQKENAKASRIVGAKTLPRLMGPDGKPLKG